MASGYNDFLCCHWQRTRKEDQPSSLGKRNRKCPHFFHYSSHHYLLLQHYPFNLTQIQESFFHNKSRSPKTPAFTFSYFETHPHFLRIFSKLGQMCCKNNELENKKIIQSSCPPQQYFDNMEVSAYIS